MIYSACAAEVYVNITHGAMGGPCVCSRNIAVLCPVLCRGPPPIHVLKREPRQPDCIGLRGPCQACRPRTPEARHGMRLGIPAAPFCSTEPQTGPCTWGNPLMDLLGPCPERRLGRPASAGHRTCWHRRPAHRLPHPTKRGRLRSVREPRSQM